MVASPVPLHSQVLLERAPAHTALAAGAPVRAPEAGASVPARMAGTMTGASTGMQRGQSLKAPPKRVRCAKLPPYLALACVGGGRGCAGDAGIPETESRKAPSFSRRRPTRTSLQEQIRQQEDFILDVWSSETAFKARLLCCFTFLYGIQHVWGSLTAVHNTRRWAACLLSPSWRSSWWQPCSRLEIMSARGKVCSCAGSCQAALALHNKCSERLSV